MRIDRTTVTQTVVDADESIGRRKWILIIATLACTRRAERVWPHRITLTILRTAGLARIDLCRIAYLG